MKNLSLNELEEVPVVVQYIWVMGASNTPIGSSIYNKAIKEYPQYFPEEVEHERKWSLIPKEVHEAYFKECHELDKVIYKDVPHQGKGIMFFVNNPKADKEHHTAWTEADKESESLRKKLHDKYYLKYGIEYNGY